MDEAHSKEVPPVVENGPAVENDAPKLSLTTWARLTMKSLVTK